MSAPVDVLAVMDAMFRKWDFHRLPSCSEHEDLLHARAAVAELIEAANAELQATPGADQLNCSMRLMKALARVGGAS